MTYQTAVAKVANDPNFCDLQDLSLAQFLALQELISLTSSPTPPVIVGVITSITRGNGALIIAPPYRSVSVTALSNDVTVDGVLVPASFSFEFSTNDLEEIVSSLNVSGSDYIITTTTNV